MDKCVKIRSLNERCATGQVQVFAPSEYEQGRRYRAEFEFHVQIMGVRADLEGEDFAMDVKSLLKKVNKRCAKFKEKVAYNIYGEEQWSLGGHAEYNERFK